MKGRSTDAVVSISKTVTTQISKITIVSNHEKGPNSQLGIPSFLSL